jgi:cytochrome c556
VQNRLFLAISLLLLAGGGVLTSSTMAQAPGIDPATVALTSTDETTLGRRLLMLSIGSNNDMLHEMLDGVLPMDELEMRGRLDSMSAMLYAFPSLYRQQPNPYTEEEAAQDSARVSLATEAVWKDFEAFKAMSYATYKRAAQAAEGNAADFKAAVDEIETMCESCHDAYRKPFEYLDFDNPMSMVK